MRHLFTVVYWAAITACLAIGVTKIAGAVEVGGAGVHGDEYPGYIRHHDMQIGAAVVGPDAPDFVTIGTYRCASMATAAKEVYYNVEVPDEWNEASDMAFHLLVFTESGDALGNGEVIEFDVDYRSVDADGNEAYDNGTLVTISPTVTGGASETDKGGYLLTAVIDYDSANQPLAVGDELGFSINRDVGSSDTYSGTVYICKGQLVYTAHSLATH